MGLKRSACPQDHPHLKSALQLFVWIVKVGRSVKMPSYHSFEHVGKHA